VSLETSVIMLLAFNMIALAIIGWIFKTSYRLRKLRHVPLQNKALPQKCR